MNKCVCVLFCRLNCMNKCLCFLFCRLNCMRTLHGPGPSVEWMTLSRPLAKNKKKARRPIHRGPHTSSR